MSTLLSFKSIESKNDVDRGKDCMKKFCESLREHTKQIINFEKKKMKLFTNEQQVLYENTMIYHICKEKLENKYAKYEKYSRGRDHCHYTRKYRGAAHSNLKCNVKFNVPNGIPVVFHNLSNYDYHFILKELAEEFEGQFPCLGENTEKHITFSVSMGKKVIRIDKKAREIP